MFFMKVSWTFIAKASIYFLEPVALGLTEDLHGLAESVGTQLPGIK